LDDALDPAGRFDDENKLLTLRPERVTVKSCAFLIGGTASARLLIFPFEGALFAVGRRRKEETSPEERWELVLPDVFLLPP
jgi:hypothetical protein